MSHLIIVVLLASQMLTPQAALHQMAIERGVDPRLAACIVTRESNWDPLLVSAADDTGLFQIIPDTAEWAAGKLGYTEYDLTDPLTNMVFGLYILDAYPEWYNTLPLCEGGR